MSPFVNQNFGLLIWIFLSIDFYLVFRYSIIKLGQSTKLDGQIKNSDIKDLIAFSSSSSSLTMDFESVKDFCNSLLSLSFPLRICLMRPSLTYQKTKGFNKFYLQLYYRFHYTAFFLEKKSINMGVRGFPDLLFFR